MMYKLKSRRLSAKIKKKKVNIVLPHKNWNQMMIHNNDNDAVDDDHATASTVASLICATSALESRLQQLGS